MATLPSPASERATRMEARRPKVAKASTPSQPSKTGAPQTVGIVHLVAEYWPFARSGGLAEAARGIAIHQAAGGSDTSVIMPLYGSIRAAGTPLVKVGGAFDVQLGPTVEQAQLYRTSIDTDGVNVYFVDHEHFFNRDGLYGDGSGDYGDNHRRFAFFAKAGLLSIPLLGLDRYVIHAHDWHTALAPVYLNLEEWDEEALAASACVLSVHNAGYQGHFGAEVLHEIGLTESLYRWDRMEWFGRLNWLKGGLVFADAVTTVSPTHAHELRTPVGGFGLHDQFIALGSRLQGVLNGIDLGIWDPVTDPHIRAQYSRDDLSGKAICKAALQEMVGLPVDPSVPLIAMTARLAKQKGFDLLLNDGLLYRIPAQFVFLGEGDLAYEQALNNVAHTVPDRVATFFDFTEIREHHLLAGADFLLMPSLYEPCGLTQMRAQRYGALPIVRRTGGLADTVDDQVTGFVFDEFETADLERTIHRALNTFREGAWPLMQHEAMTRDFGWAKSAERYGEIYASALELAVARATIAAS